MFGWREGEFRNDSSSLFINNLKTLFKMTPLEFWLIAVTALLLVGSFTDNYIAKRYTVNSIHYYLFFLSLLISTLMLLYIISTQITIK